MTEAVHQNLKLIVSKLFLVFEFLCVRVRIVICGSFRDGSGLEEKLPPQHAHARRWPTLAAPKKQKTDVGADVLLRVARCAGNDCNFFSRGSQRNQKLFY